MRRFIKSFLLIFIVIALGLFWFSKTEKGGSFIVNSLADSSSYSLEKDVAYGAGPRHVMDIYLARDEPADPKSSGQKDIDAALDERPEPVLVFIHGGGWNRGDKSMYKFIAESFTREGYDIILPNYRLYPEVKYPEFLNDVAAALAKVQKIYPTRPIILMGHSAGAYNALMMSFTPEFLQNAGIEPCYTIKGIVSLAGPTGAYPMEEEPYTTIFPSRLIGDDAALAHVNEMTPPLLLISGDKDKSVNFRNSVALGDALKDRNIATVKIYAGANHIDVISEFSTLLDERGSVREDVLGFISGLPEDEGDGFCR